MGIVFMGTPEFAAYILSKLVENNYNVLGVVTAPDRKQGRGRQLKGSAVKAYAEKTGLTVFQPENLKDPSFAASLKELKADLFVVVAFRMLPKIVWQIPAFGTFNLHASLLPQYRGAAPINWAIMNGEKVTGVTTFYIDDKIDTGEILLQEEVPISSNDTAGVLHEKLKTKGASLVMKTIDAIENGEIVSKSQKPLESKELKVAPKLFKEECKIDWSNGGIDIWNKIKGLSPYPAAWSELIDKKNGELISFKLFDVDYIPSIGNSKGKSNVEIISDGKKELIISTIDSAGIKVNELQLSGKKRMKTEDLLRGLDISNYKLNLNP